MAYHPLDFRLILRSYLRHWQHVPEALNTLLADSLAATLPDSLAVSLKALQGEGWQQRAHLKAAEQALNETVPILRASTAQERALADLLHATLEQDVSVVSADFLADRQWWQDLLPADMQSKLLSDTSPVETITELQNLLAALEGLALPTPPPSLVQQTLPRGIKSCHIWVVENQPYWQQDIEELLQLLQTQLPNVQLSWELFDHAEGLRSTLSQGQKNDRRPPGSFQVVIADLGIPQTPQGPESRQNGIDLILTLRDYQLNLPVVVLTSPAHLPGDQLRLSQAGIAPSDYIFKSGTESLLHLRQSLLSLLQRASSHQIQIGTDSQSHTVDDLPLKLTPAAHRVFVVLAELSASHGAGVYFSASKILEKLYPESTKEERQYWDAQVLKRFPQYQGMTDLINLLCPLMQRWNTLLAESKIKPLLALQDLKQVQSTNWRLLRELILDEAGVPRKSQTEVEWLNRYLGRVPLPKLGKPKQVQDAVLQIRKSLHQTFSRAGLWVDVSAEILVNKSGSEPSGYRLQGKISLPENPDTRSQNRRWQVLALENQIIRQERLQVLFHESPHFQLELAVSVQSGVAAFKAKSFDALLLDLHLPESNQDWRTAPDSGSADGGIRALKAILEIHKARQAENSDLPNLAILVPTQFSEREDLRQAMAQLGVPPDSIIPCDRGGLWEAHLMLNLERLRQAWELHQILPLYERWQCPQVTILKSTDSTLHVQVNGQALSYRGNQARMLTLLLKKPGQWVSLKTLTKQIYGDQPAPALGIKQLAKNLHKSIREHWLPSSLPAGVSPKEAALWLLEYDSASKPGYVLHAWVQPSA